MTPKRFRGHEPAPDNGAVIVAFDPLSYQASVVELVGYSQKILRFILRAEGNVSVDQNVTLSLGNAVTPLDKNDSG